MLKCLILLVVALPPTYATVLAASSAQLQQDYSKDRDRNFELIKQKRFKEAIEGLKKTVAQNQSDYLAWYYLGIAQLETSNVIESAKSFENSILAEPNFARAHSGLALALLFRNLSKEAIRSAQTAISIDSNSYDAHYVIGLANLRAGLKDQALQQAETALRLNPQFAPAYLLKSQATASLIGNAVGPESKPNSELLERYRSAADALEEYLRLSPDVSNKELWQEQLDALRFFSAYQPPSAGVNGKIEKPRVLKQPSPSYTEAARKLGISGIVILRCLFDADGTVKHIWVVQGLPEGLTEVSIKAAKKIVFTPATVDGKPVSRAMQVEHMFSLK